MKRQDLTRMLQFAKREATHGGKLQEVMEAKAEFLRILIKEWDEEHN